MSIVFDTDSIFQVVFRFADPSGNVGLNVAYYQNTGVVAGFPPAILPAVSAVAGPMAAAMHADLKAAWRATASSEVTFTGVSVQSVHPGPRSALYTYVAPGTNNGLIESDMLPMQDCPTILKRTPYGQRWGLGRWFCIGCPESGQEVGRINFDQATKYDDLAAAIADPVEFTSGTPAYTWQMIPVLYTPYRPADEDGPGNPLRITAITSCALSNDVIKTQRRRRPGKGI